MSKNSNVTIVGGGITGLYAALQALDAGKTDIHIYEKNAELGGKLKTADLHGNAINMGAEFIDSDDEVMIALCQRLGVRLIHCKDQEAYGFQSPSGKLMPDFLEQYAPIAEKIISDRHKIMADPQCKLAQRIKSCSLSEYLEELRTHPEFARIPKEVFETGINAFAAEVGQTPDKVTADQFISETMRSAEKFLVSDCGYRVAGGTTEIIRALTKYLWDHGVHFHQETLTDIHRKGDGNIKLSLRQNNKQQNVTTSAVFLALPAYELTHIKGWESLGLTNAKKKFADIQYTSLVKFTIAEQPGVQLPNVNLFAPNVQSYSPIPGYRTFLAYNSGNLKPKELIDQHLAFYAGAFGKKPEELFKLEPGNIVFENPGNDPCFSTPSPHNYAQMKHFFTELEELSKSGLGVVGSYYPFEGAVGFMECGVNSVDRVANRVLAPQETRLDKNTLSHGGFVTPRTAVQKL